MSYIEKFKLKNKLAFVVGSGLIGLKIINAFLEAEAKVILIDKIKNNTSSLKKNNKFKFEKIDISNINLIEKKYHLLTKKYGVPHVFVNCSYPKTKDWKQNSFSKIKADSFSKNINLHLNTFSWLAKIVADSMIRNKIKGSIIQLSSIYGVVGQNLNIYEGTNMKESMTYSVIKGGINNLTRQMASYYGKYGIRVNSLCAGGVEDKKQVKRFKKNYSKNVPMRRLAKSEEIALSALFLSSDASSYITGTSFMVDGGWTAI